MALQSEDRSYPEPAVSMDFMYMSIVPISDLSLNEVKCMSDVDHERAILNEVMENVQLVQRKNQFNSCAITKIVMGLKLFIPKSCWS